MRALLLACLIGVMLEGISAAALRRASPEQIARRTGAMQAQYKHDRLLIFEQGGIADGGAIDVCAMIVGKYQGLVSVTYAQQIAAFYGFGDFVDECE